MNAEQSEKNGNETFDELVNEVNDNPVSSINENNNDDDNDDNNDNNSTNNGNNSTNNSNNAKVTSNNNDDNNNNNRGNNNNANNEQQPEQPGNNNNANNEQQLEQPGNNNKANNEQQPEQPENNNKANNEQQPEQPENNNNANNEQPEQPENNNNANNEQPEQPENNNNANNEQPEEQQPEPETLSLREAFIERLKQLKDDIEKQEKHFHELLTEKERVEIDAYEKGIIQDDETSYPNPLNPQFNLKIAAKKEFYDTKYEESSLNVKQQADALCNQEFELAPYQIFVRNFMSYHTPYNGLLLFHGVGTGKTCSAISICENTRDYMKKMNMFKKIIVLASVNLQKNFRKQLFDENKLVEINGSWMMKQSCVGSRLLKEMNPLRLKGYTKEMVVKEINAIIDQHYEFMGYAKFSNQIEKIVERFEPIEDPKLRKEYLKRQIKEEYSGRMFVIDEVHNIRISEFNKNKRVLTNLMRVLTYSKDTKLLLLSATPMFNSHTEIILLLNLLNTNDGRAMIKIGDVFDKEGLFIEDNQGNPIGKERFIQKLRGYVSFVRGENIYTFPYRIFPKDFDERKSIKSQAYESPSRQLNGNPIVQNIEFMDLFMVDIGSYQYKCYEYIKKRLREDFPEKDDMEIGIGWKIVDPLIQCLNMTYPLDELTQQNEVENYDDVEVNIRDMIGVKGINSVMHFDDGQIDLKLKKRRGYKYKKECIRDYGEIFNLSHIEKYSSKIFTIMNRIRQSSGVVLVFSQYVDSGCIPVALALEELGYKPFSQKNKVKPLFSTPRKEVDVFSGKTQEEHELSEMSQFHPATYTMITGDKNLTQDLDSIMNVITDEDNKDGRHIKVVIISASGSEGIDFKFIRQVHVMDPWYNNNRNEQVIGRAVRFCSHSLLDFEERNVEIYLYGTNLKTKEEEAIDLFIYRLAETKSLKIGQVARMLKSTAVDCIMMSEYSDQSVDKIMETVNIKLSSGKTISYKIGDKPFTELCDYMDSCSYQCIPDFNDEQDGDEKIAPGSSLGTYDIKHVEFTVDHLIQKIKEVYKTKHILRKNELIKEVSIQKEYTKEQINMALDTLINDKNEYLVDMFERLGRLQNVGELYYYQPLELKGRATSFDRERPVDFKHKNIIIKRDQIDKNMDDDIKKDIDIDIVDIMKKDDKKYNASSESSDNRQIREDKEKHDRQLNKLIENLKSNYKDVKDSSKTLTSANRNWYKSAANSISRILNRFEEHPDENNVDIEVFYKYAVHHSYDTLKSSDKLKVIKYLLSKQQPYDDDEYEKYLREYVDKQVSIKLNDDIVYRIFVSSQKLEYYYYDKQINELNNLESYKVTLLKKVRELETSKTTKKINKLVGFIYPFKDTNDMVFKTKYFDTKRNKGAHCSQKSKSLILKMLNLIVNGDEKMQVYEKGDKMEKRIKAFDVCSELELMMRYYNDVKHINEVDDNKTLFYFSPEMSKLYDIENKLKN
jgi:hypothetical protein